MTDRPLRRVAAKPLLHAEDIDQILERFRIDMADAADALAAATNAEPNSVPDADEVSTHAATVLRSWLEDETLALVEPEGDRGIDAHELHREILKKALAGLKRNVLQTIAASRRLKPEPNLDELARQVAQAYGWDEAAIARLVLDYADDPRETEGGLSTRIFLLKKPVDLDYVVERLNYVDGRYYRTDIAKWFTFSGFTRVGSVLTVRGALQAYKATVDSTSDNRVSADINVSDCTLQVNAGSTDVLVHQAKSYAVARSMLAAFKVATAAETIATLPQVQADAEIVPRRLHPATVFLLDLVSYQLRGHLFRERNPVLARFRLSRHEQGESLSARKPTLRAVRFEGENLLDSPTACGLMWTEGRPLTDVTLSVLATKSGDDSSVRGRLPIRIALERGAVLVQTGLANSDVELIREVHNAVVTRVQASLTEASAPSRVAALVSVIKRQAEDPDLGADAQLLDDGWVQQS